MNGDEASTSTPTIVTCGAAALTARPMPLASPPPPSGITTTSNAGMVLDDLQADRAGAGDDIRMVVGRDVDAAFCLGEFLGLLFGGVVVLAVGMQYGAVPANRVLLGFGRGLPA